MNNFRRRAESGLTFNANHETVINGITFVDLGLPSGTLWAKYNPNTNYTWQQAHDYVSGSGHIKAPTADQAAELIGKHKNTKFETTTYVSVGSLGIRGARRITSLINGAVIYFCAYGYDSRNTDIPYAWTSDQYNASEGYYMTNQVFEKGAGGGNYMLKQHKMSIWPVYNP